jgi:hypothetical protein
MSSESDGVACATGSPSFRHPAYAMPAAPTPAAKPQAALWPIRHAVQRPTPAAARRRGHGLEVRPRRTAIV